MLEILGSILDLCAGLLSHLAGVVSLVATSVWDVLYHLHVSAPRLEGLLVGVLLAWLMMRRDKHPLIRVLSAPLKLVVDILDLAWDQAVEILCDLKDVAVGWTRSCLGAIRDRVSKGYAWVMSSLSGIKSRLVRK